MPRDTEPERQMPGDGDVTLRKAGRAHQPAPLLGHKGTRDGNSPVTQYEMMPARKPGEQAKTVIWQPVAMQVADEPATSRVRLHPADEHYHLVVGEMMRELRAHDEIEFLRRIDREYVGVAIGDGRAGFCRVACRPGRPWIEVHTHQPRCNPASRCPALNATQRIAMAARNI